MQGYYLHLALRSFGRNRLLTLLMVLTIAVGIGAAMTTVGVYRALSGDPIPGKSERLFIPRLEPRTLGKSSELDAEPLDQMTRHDAEALLRQRRGQRQALMSAGAVTVQPTGAAAQPYRVMARFTSADFFPMFDVPMRSGSAWHAADDAASARVAVISRKLAVRLFGSGDPIGGEIPTPQGILRVIGVLGDWNPTPRFYDLNVQRFGGSEELFLPFSTSREMNLDTQGNMNCWGESSDKGEGGQRGPNAPCAWLQYWVELASADDASAYRDYLLDYSEQQRAAGRFERPANVRLDTVMQWLEYKRVVPADVRLQVWMALGFLLVCLINTVSLLLAKFLRRTGEIGIRRSLGASRRDIFQQCLIEAGAIGLAGGVLGLAVAAAGLWLVRQQPDDYAYLARMDLTLLWQTLAFAVLASLLAGLLPAWRAMRIPPALQLKSQ